MIYKKPLRKKFEYKIFVIFTLILATILSNCVETQVTVPIKSASKKAKHSIKDSEDLKLTWTREIPTSERLKILKELESRGETENLIYCFDIAGAFGGRTPMRRDDRLFIVGALGRLKDPIGVPLLTKLLYHRETAFKTEALYSLGKIKDPASVDSIYPLLFDQNPSVRVVSVHALGEIGDPKAIGRVSMLLTDNNEKVKNLAEVTLRKLGASENDIKEWKAKADQMTIEDVYESKLAYQRTLREKEALESQLKIYTDRQSISQKAGSTSERLNFGKYLALVIGNNEYNHLSKLKTAVNDAKSISTLLGSSYGFETMLILNGTRRQILSALDYFRNNLTQNDNFLIYYAGHGYYDKAADRGYWLPVDATKETSADWISNADITDKLKAIRAKHVIIIADSCYSGTLIRGIKIVDKRSDYFNRISQKRSRTVLTSGGFEPVSDSGGGNHSVFAKALLGALHDNISIMDGTELFSRIRRPVILDAPQTPQYSDIRLRYSQ